MVGALTPTYRRADWVYGGAYEGGPKDGVTVWDAQPGDPRWAITEGAPVVFHNPDGCFTMADFYIGEEWTHVEFTDTLRSFGPEYGTWSYGYREGDSPGAYIDQTGFRASDSVVIGKL